MELLHVQALSGTMKLISDPSSVLEARCSVERMSTHFFFWNSRLIRNRNMTCATLIKEKSASSFAHLMFYIAGLFQHLHSDFFCV